MNEQSRLSDSEVTDLLRRRTARPAPNWLASAILESLASERARHPARTAGRSAKRPLILLAAATVLVGGGALAATSGALRLWSTTLPDPRSAFVGTWVSTSDADGGIQTMTVTLAERSVAIVLTDTIATVCSGTSSTMTGSGTVDGDSLVIATPDYRCDDGSKARAFSGPPLEEQLRNLTFRRDAAQDFLTAGGGIWLRDGAAPPSYEPMASPGSQADPAAVAAQAAQRMDQFLAARIAGTGADGLVTVEGDASVDVPLLYTTTSGAPYERFEIVRVEGPQWPRGDMTFIVRLYANHDATVVQQRIAWYPDTGLSLDANSTTENGRPTSLAYTSDDGEVTVSAPSATWNAWLPGKAGDVWFGGLWQPGDDLGTGSPSIGLVDPVAYDAWCMANGGSPLLSAPADAASIAQQLLADPNFEATAPVAARIGGLDAVSMDVALAPGGRACGIWGIEISRWIHELQGNPELRMRLFLVDLPDGMSVKTLAITVKAPKDQFDAYLAETAPIIESIEFHPDGRRHAGG